MGHYSYLRMGEDLRCDRYNAAGNVPTVYGVAVAMRLVRSAPKRTTRYQTEEVGFSMDESWTVISAAA